MTEPIRVLLVDDDPLVRSALRLILSSSGRFELVGEASDGDQVIAAVQRHRPDVILMDLRMARVDGVAATEAVQRLPEPPFVVVLTTWDVDEAVTRSISAGASGYILKSAAPDEIMRAVEAVAGGDAMLSPRSTRRLLESLRQRDDSPRSEAQARMARLTDREREVAVAVAEGLTNAEIGARLFLAEATVKSNLAAIQAKLGLANRTMLAVLAERSGLVR